MNHKNLTSLLIIWCLAILPLFSLRNVHAQSNKTEKEKSSSRNAEVIKLDQPSGTPSGDQKRFALIIGVDQYTELNPLGGAVNDAKELEKTLIENAGFLAEDIIILTTNADDEKKPTRNNIFKHFAKLKRQIIALDGSAMLLVAFAGHGKDNYLFPSDAVTGDDDLLKNTAISLDDLRTQMLGTKAKQLFLILDACRDAPNLPRSNPDKEKMSADVSRVFDFSKNREIEGFVIMLATSPGFSAYEIKNGEGKGHGYFTYEFINALRDKAGDENGDVTLDNLVKYLEEQVVKRVDKDIGTGLQKPRITSSDNFKTGNFIISRTTPTLRLEELKTRPLPKVLPSGRTDKFKFRVEANQFVKIEIDRQETEVNIRLIDSATKKNLLETNSSYDLLMPVSLVVTSPKDTRFQLEINSTENSSNGNYVIRVMELRLMQTSDTFLVNGQIAMFEAMRLHHVEEKMAQAIDNYEVALLSWRTQIETKDPQTGSVTKVYADQRNEARTLRYLANLYEETGDKQKALEYYEQALTPLRALRDKTGEALVLTLISKLFLTQGKQKEALEYLEKVATTLQLRRESEIIVKLKPSFDRTGEQTKSEFTLKELEKAKAVEAIVDFLGELRKERSELVAKKVKTSEEDARLSRIDNEIAAATRAFESAWAKRVEESAKSIQGTGKVSKLQTALKELGNGTVALYTIVGENNLTLLLTTPNIQKAYRYSIAATDLNRKIADFRSALQNTGVDPRPLGRELYDILVRPVVKDLEAIQAKTLLWSLDGALRYIPIAALYDGERYMVEKYQNAILTPSSMSQLTVAPNPKPSVLAAGVSKPARVGNINFSALPGVEKELREILQIVPGKSILNETFTKTALSENSGRYPIVHLASHYYFDLRSSADSYFLLGDGSRLTLQEIRSIPDFFKSVDLLVLSAVNTGLNGVEADGKEVEGLAVIAQQQGAKAVIATLWGISDDATAELFIRFYKLTKENPQMTKVEALRQAQLSLLTGATTQSKQKSDKPFAHPYFWSPFVLYGNPR